MSTRSLILKEKGNSLVGIYCHFDGYPSGVGATLDTYYKTPKKVDELIALGDISSLGSKIAPSSGAHTVSQPQEDVTVAYHRDRGEELHQVNTTYDELEEVVDDMFVDYVYVFTEKDKKWKEYAKNKFVLIKKAIEMYE